MLYIRLLWDIFTFKSFKVAMYFFCSLSVVLILGFFSEIQNSWRSLFDQGGESPHFFAIMDTAISTSQLRDRVLGIKSIVNITSLNTKASQLKISQSLKSLGVEIPPELLKENLGMYEVQLKMGSDREMQQEARNYFLHEFLSDGVMATDIQGQELVKDIGPLKIWLRDYFIFTILVGLMFLSIFSLWEFAKESSYRANVIESFHRKKNVALKMFLFSWPPLALGLCLIPMIWGAVEITTMIFLLFWLLLNLSITIMCQHTYYVKRSH